MVEASVTLEEARALDSADPLRGFRDRFLLPEGLVYLDGNSLGAMPLATAARIADTVEREWGEGMIGSWNAAGWVTAPQRIGAKIARLIGAEADEVIAADSTSINVFKALTAALSLRPGRRVILSERTNFPTDVYMMQGLAAFAGIEARTVAPEDLVDNIDDSVAVLLLTQVHYKTGAVRDMAEVTARAHAAGALVVWDLSHSAGAIPVDLNGAGADFAVGCGYKYLNGGPGAPAFLFAARRHQADAAPVLSGWFGHAQPFAFDENYAPADGVTRFLCGTPPILGLAALEVGVDLMLEADMGAIRSKSVALTGLFIELMEPLCTDFGFRLASPRQSDRRGSQVSYSHPNGYEIMQALIARDVIGDFRAPDILRFGVTPLYTRYADVAEAVTRLRDICDTRGWDREEFRVRSAVT